MHTNVPFVIPILSFFYLSFPLCVPCFHKHTLYSIDRGNHVNTSICVHKQLPPFSQCLIPSLSQTSATNKQRWKDFFVPWLFLSGVCKSWKMSERRKRRREQQINVSRKKEKKWKLNSVELLHCKEHMASVTLKQKYCRPYTMRISEHLPDWLLKIILHFKSGDNGKDRWGKKLLHLSDSDLTGSGQTAALLSHFIVPCTFPCLSLYFGIWCHLVCTFLHSKPLLILIT